MIKKMNVNLHKVNWKYPIMMLFSLMSTISTYAQFYDFKAESDGTTIYYDIKGKNVAVVNGDYKYTGNITIPESVLYEGNTYTVTELSSFSFNGCSGLESISLPGTLETIGMYALKDCNSLKSLSIPNNVSSIGSNAFVGCANLTQVALSSSLKSIENSTFQDCKNLRSMSIPHGVKRIGNMAFQGCRSMKDINLPNSINSIGSFAFEDCSNLDSIAFPEELTVLEKYVFSGCTKLRSAVLSKNISTIEDNAFSGCTSLSYIYIPNSVSYIGDWAFSGCKSVKEIHSEIYNPFAISNYTFERNVKKSATLTIPYGTASRYKTAYGWEFEIMVEKSVANYSVLLWGVNSEILASYTSSMKPKITFMESSLIVSSNNIDIECFDLLNVSKITYQDDTNVGISNVKLDDTDFKMEGDVMTFPKLKQNSTISIYTLNGTCLKRDTCSGEGSYKLDISNIGTGVYLVKVNGLTFKIYKK